jgi:hypothetical protein
VALTIASSTSDGGGDRWRRDGKQRGHNHPPRRRRENRDPEGSSPAARRLGDGRGARQQRGGSARDGKWRTQSRGAKPFQGQGPAEKSSASASALLPAPDDGGSSSGWRLAGRGRRR